MSREPEEQLADWKAKTDAATEGPWRVLDQKGALGIEADDDTYVVEPPLYLPDAEFIAMSRTEFPKLLAAAYRRQTANTNHP